MPNRLARETSPYLLQHANDPVDWYPWGEEALNKAKAENKPIFLSIGYSACHWCHVMGRESFKDEVVAAILNEHFVSIKVDREERPDIDHIYMRALQYMTGTGGWPISLFLTPDGEPFFGGTYFPPTPRYGLPSFKEVLMAVADAWQNHREELVEMGKSVVKSLKELSTLTMKHEEVESKTLNTAFHQIRQLFDWTHGGWGEAPKFPQPMILEFLLRYNYTTNNTDALQMVKKTLEAMGRGGIYDQLGGGFHRYSVDNHWLIPHFEKMLYDNAQLATVYLHAWQVTGETFYRTIAEEILDYVVREMTSPEGGFYSTQDADSEGEEGKFYLWTAKEIRTVLGKDSEAFITAYGVSEEGNFEGRNILKFIGSIDQRERLSHLRQKLFEVRNKRVHPMRDEKILTSWNGLMLSAFAEAARVLSRDDYRQVARRNAEFILSNLRTPEGRLLHMWKDGKAKINGYLEDYTHLTFGLLELYQTTFEPRWYVIARELVEIMLEQFSSPDGGFFDVSNDFESMLIRPRMLEDNALPSGNGMAVYVLLKLGGLSNEPRYTERAYHILGQAHSLVRGYPLYFGQWLIALNYALSHPRAVAIVGYPESADTRALLEVCIKGYRPNQVVAFGTPENSPITLLQGRTLINGHATAYVCVDFTCHPPITDPEVLQKVLKNNKAI